MRELLNMFTYKLTCSRPSLDLAVNLCKEEGRNAIVKLLSQYVLSTSCCKLEYVFGIQLKFLRWCIAFESVRSRHFSFAIRCIADKHCSTRSRTR